MPVKPVPHKKTGKSASKKATSDESPLIIKSGKITVPVSHPEKVYWPGENITKGMMVDYYPKKIPLMAIADNYNLFLNFYVAIIFGKKYF